MRYSTTLAMVAGLTLMGCASGAPPMQLKRRPPPNLIIPCPSLPQPDSGRLGDLLLNHVETAALYHTCRERQRALADWARSE